MVHLSNHTHENIHISIPAFDGVKLVEFHDVQPNKAWRGGGGGQREIVGGSYWQVAMWQVAVVPILSPRYHGSLVWNHSPISELATCEFKVALHANLLVFSTQSSSGWFFKQIIMFLWYIRDSYEFWWDYCNWSVLMVIWLSKTSTIQPLEHVFVILGL